MMIRRFLYSLDRMTSPRKDESQGAGVVIKEGLVFYLKYVVIAFLIIVVVLTVSKWLGVDIHNKMSTSAFKESARANLPIRLLQMCLLGPLLEELHFRLWLSFKRVHLGITLFFLSYVLLTKFVFPHEHDVYWFGYHSIYFGHAGPKVLISGLLASSVLLLKQDWLSSLSDKTKHTIIYASLFCFAALHLTNIVCPSYLYPFMLVLCLPQLILGATVTYYRIQIGFFAGLAFHCLLNFMVALPSYGKDIVSLLW